MSTSEPTLSRTLKKKERTRQALIDAGYHVMARKDIDAATMHQIAERADVAAGTVYNYFSSKDDLAMCVMEEVMARLARRIDAVTNTFRDPAQVYAFGIRIVIEAAIYDKRLRLLLRRTEVISDAMYRQFGPYAIRDISAAVAAGRYNVDNPALVWRMACYAIAGFSLAVCDGKLEPDLIEEAVIDLLGMVGLSRDAARELAARPCPALPHE